MRHRECPRRDRAAVIGGGSWGTALAHILATHGYRTLLWMRDTGTAAEINERRTNARYLGDASLDEKVEATVDLAEAARWGDFIIIAVPSKAFRKIAYRLGAHITGDQVLVTATKGLEAESLSRMSEVLREETCARKIGALSGPNLAAEVVAGHPTATVVASAFEEVIERAERVLAGPRFRLYGNFDLVGVELAGALKNIYAIAAGLCAGMGFGANTLSAVITRGLAEMSRFGQHFGAQRLTFQGLAGVGDLVATCGSTLSRNHTVGRHLAAGETLDAIVANLGMVAEGVNTTRVVHTFSKREGIYMPIASAVHGLLFEGLGAEQAIASLMDRESHYEDLDMPIHGIIGRPHSVTDAAATAAIAHTGD